ncbi:MAG: hypothetical protein GTO45_27045 [Candidatus Aminicenantes bacterium]|nr:hypothetical protein [Candidatus Aminicenantes bacterium]NIM82441.1 hypothetical protein [Candidatus Aminicenantes bacterium]NIN21802.1 hypothetical protein [Candidatus Aminicenantes bacterium]NIN45594.1 hypothetical protein [Candidatus Aminicenantes bacterium]NIN88425.1 hypothetical protein [Candidatus Aminicenantes bacterium]
MGKLKKTGKENIEDILALTPMQEGMLFYYLEDPQGESYFEQLTLEFSGEIEVEVFEKAWNFVIETNEMLRTVFRWEKLGSSIQIILKKHQLQLRYFDLSCGDIGHMNDRLEEIKVNDRRDKFLLLSHRAGELR